MYIIITFFVDKMSLRRSVINLKVCNNFSIFNIISFRNPFSTMFLVKYCFKKMK